MVEAQAGEGAIGRLHVEAVECEVILRRPPAARRAPGPRDLDHATVGDCAADVLGQSVADAHARIQRRAQRADCEAAGERAGRLARCVGGAGLERRHPKRVGVVVVRDPG